MPTQAALGARRKIVMSFTAACAAIIALTGAVIQFQLGAVDRGAQVEARDLARSVAYSAALDSDHLQHYVEGLHGLYGSDIVVVDAQKRSLADADPTEIDQVFDHDPANEVGKTIKDGRVRVFVERSINSPDGAKQLTVPRYETTGVEGPIVGAVIVEYTQIYQELLGATTWQIYSVAAAGLLCAVLVGFLGVKLNASLWKRLREDMLAAQKIEYLAFHDRLTGLSNRGMFSRTLEQGLQEAKRYNRQLAVLFCRSRPLQEHQ